MAARCSTGTKAWASAAVAAEQRRGGCARMDKELLFCACVVNARMSEGCGWLVGLVGGSWARRVCEVREEEAVVGSAKAVVVV